MSFELAWPPRSHRVRFKKAVRVVPLVDGPPRAFRVLSGNLSKQGMFLAMPEPLAEGTKVALSLEAGGRVLPFAQAEVMWRSVGEGDGTVQPGKGAAGGAGFGVRFTNFLHPRAHELVEYLVSNLDTGRPLALPPKKRWKKVAKWGGGLAASLALAGLGVILARQISVAPPEPMEHAEPVAAVEPAPEAPAPAEAAPDAPAAVAAAPEPVAAPEPEPAIQHEPVPQEPVLAAAQPEAVARPAAPLASTGLLPLPKCGASSLRWQQRDNKVALEVAPASGAKFAAAFRMKSPERLVIDLDGAAPKRSHVVKSTDIPNVVSLRIGKRKTGGTRLVLDLKKPAALKVDGSRIELSY